MTWHLYRQALTARAVALLALATLEVVRYGVDWPRLRREASYTMRSAKLFGLLAFGVAGSVLTGAICRGIRSDLEGLPLCARLNRWRADVPSWLHAQKSAD